MHSLIFKNFLDQMKTIHHIHYLHTVIKMGSRGVIISYCKVEK